MNRTNDEPSGPENGLLLLDKQSKKRRKQERARNALKKAVAERANSQVEQLTAKEAARRESATTNTKTTKSKRSPSASPTDEALNEAVVSSTKTKKRTNKSKKVPSLVVKRELLSSDTEVFGMVTPKKQKPGTVPGTPPTVESNASSVCRGLSQRLNLATQTPPKKPSSSKSSVKLQAHMVDWVTDHGLTVAIVKLYPDCSPSDVADMSSGEKLSEVLDCFQPKELISVYPMICFKKGIELLDMDLNAAFSTKAKACRTITDTLTPTVDLQSDEFSSSDEEV